MRVVTTRNLYCNVTNPNSVSVLVDSYTCRFLTLAGIAPAGVSLVTSPTYAAEGEAVKVTLSWEECTDFDLTLIYGDSNTAPLRLVYTVSCTYM